MLANIKPGQEVLDQLEYVDSLVAKDTRGRLANPPGLYVMYIRDAVAPPPAFNTSRKRALLEQSRQRKRLDQAEAAQRKLDYESFCAAETTRYIDDLPPAEYNALLVTHRRQNKRLFTEMSSADLEVLSQGTVHSEIQHSRRVALPTFDEFADRQ